MSIRPADTYHLEVNLGTVVLGPRQIPIGEVSSADIYGNKHEVRLYCKKGAMGLQKEAVLNFQLETAQKVAELVKGLLLKTKSGHFISVCGLETRFTPLGSSLVMGSATFTLNSAGAAPDFAAYIAPVYFPGYDIIQDLSACVTVTSQEGNEAEIIQQMREAFLLLNAHTHDTLNGQLILNRDPRFPGIARTRGSEEMGRYHYRPTFAITPYGVLKEKRILKNPDQRHLPGGWEYEMQPLDAFTKEKAQAVFANLENSVTNMKETSTQFPEFLFNIQPILDQGVSILAKGKPTNAFEMEVFLNQQSALQQDWEKATQPITDFMPKKA